MSCDAPESPGEKKGGAMPLRLRPELILLACSTFASASIAEAQGCFTSVESTNRTISVAASGARTDVSIWNYPDGIFDEGTPTCHASARVKLSSFPSSRLALRPREVAEAMRDAVDELGVSECVVVVWYENDTQDDFEENELCKTEVFRYDGDSYWSSSPEENCWDAASEA
jgi:hypothetical protein